MEFIEHDETLEKLTSELREKEVHEWLDEFHATLKLDETAFQGVVNKRHIFPNQNGAGDIDTTLMEILALLGTDLRDQLLDPKITTDLDDLSQRDGAFVVKEIAATIGENLNDRAATNDCALHFRSCCVGSAKTHHAQRRFSQSSTSRSTCFMTTRRSTPSFPRV